MTAFIILMTVPVVFISFFIFNFSKNAFEKEITTVSEQLIKSSAEKLDGELKYVESLCEELSMDVEIQNSLLKRDKLGYVKSNQIRENITYKFIDKMRISILGLSSDITSIDIILKDKTIIGAGHNNYNKEELYNIYNLSKYSSKKFNYKIVDDINGENQIAVGLNVLNNRTGEHIGVLVVTFKENYVKNTCNSLNLGSGSEVILINEKGFVVSSNKNSSFIINNNFFDYKLVNEIYNNSGIHLKSIKKDNKSYMITFHEIKSSNWEIIGIIPVDFVQKNAKNLMWFIIIVVIVILNISIIVALKISHSISEPIEKLKELMVCATEGKLDVEVEKIGNDEVGEMSEAFNIMIKSIRDLLQENDDTKKEIIYKLGEMIEIRSKETGNHVHRVAHITRIIALKLGMDDGEAEQMKIASTLHDIGKISIPDNILHKPGKLTVEEFEIMKTHSKTGYEVLSNSSRVTLKLAARIALEHHERYDGTGYPYGLAEEKISMAGRIVALADVFDALSSKRVYKDAWEWEKVLDYIEEQRSHQFDPSVVDAFFECLCEIKEIKEKFTDDI